MFAIARYILDRALAKSWVLPFAQPSQDLAIATSDRVEREFDAV